MDRFEKVAGRLRAIAINPAHFLRDEIPGLAIALKRRYDLAAWFRRQI